MPPIDIEDRKSTQIQHYCSNIASLGVGELHKLTHIFTLQLTQFAFTNLTIGKELHNSFREYKDAPPARLYSENKRKRNKRT